MTLLGYRALSGIAGAVSSFAGAIRGLGSAGTTAAAGMDTAAVSAGRLSTLASRAGAAVGGAFAGYGLGSMFGGALTGGDPEAQRDFGVAGSLALGGTMLGPWGAVAGLGAAGGYLGFRALQEAGITA
jgi:hypothetical protein